MRHYLSWNIHLICISQKLLEPVMHKLHSYQFTGMMLDRINPLMLDLLKRRDNLCRLWHHINKDSEPVRADLSCNQRSVSCNTGHDIWIKRERWCLCMCVRVCRLIKCYQNEKSVTWPGNKIPIFVFHCPVEAQLCRENIGLHHGGINSDVHPSLPKSGPKTNTAWNVLFLPEKKQPSISKFWQVWRK